MRRPSAATVANPTALFLSPEPPFPAIGGGPLRSASILTWLQQHYTVDLITFWDPQYPSPQPELQNHGFRHIHILKLKPHDRRPLARLARNLHRAWRSAPPLFDRLSGYDAAIAEALTGHHYDLALLEHFWVAHCAPTVRPHTRRLVLDLHNVESVLAERMARTRDLQAPLHAEFAHAYHRLQAQWLPAFDDLFVTSQADAAALAHCPAVTPVIVPNTLPCQPLPQLPRQPLIAFSGNLAYEPNLQAAHWFHHSVWPELSRRHPHLTWLLIGKNQSALQRQFASDPRIRFTGFVDDAVAALATAQLAVVPLLTGSGTRLKILEAWAAGTPVVSTSIGAEGITGHPGQHWLQADSPADFLHAIDSLLSSPNLVHTLTTNARQKYENEYTWPTAWRHLDQWAASSHPSQFSRGVQVFPSSHKETK